MKVITNIGLCGDSYDVGSVWFETFYYEYRDNRPVTDAVWFLRMLKGGGKVLVCVADGVFDFYKVEDLSNMRLVVADIKNLKITLECVND
jgi:hypothetical protein